MSFYLKPPRGQIHRSKVVELARQRVSVLLRLNNNSSLSLEDLLVESVNESDSIKEGTPKDRISHFTLKLIASVSTGYFQDFFVSSERALFSLRIEKASLEVLHSYLEELLSHLQELLSNGKVEKNTLIWFNTLANLRDAIEEESEFQQDTRTSIQIKVPFQLVPSFVKRRIVPIVNGEAIIGSDHCKELLKEAFQYFLQESITYVSSDSLDDFSVDLVSELLNLFTESQYQGLKLNGCGARIRVEEISDISNFFPPCFLGVHQTLIQENRLHHSARFAYTLFLKEIGLPLEEATKFWSKMYSRERRSNSGCCHSWQGDSGRYLYSIRHMYGLEGRRKQYSAHSCQAIQTRDSSPTEQLVCPFKVRHMDEKENNMATACKNHLEEKLGRKIGKNFSKPSHFYFLAQGLEQF